MRLASTSIFVLPHEDRYLVYAPVRGLLLQANAAAVARLRESCERGDPSLLDEGLARSLGGTDWIFSKEVPAPLPLDRAFAPTQVTLFLGSRCNLRCVYCYADAGMRPSRRMEGALARAAIEYAFTHAQAQEQPLHVGFHGGGEPTLAWAGLTAAVVYAEEVAREHAPGLRLSLVTNGVLSEEQVEFITEHFRGGIVLSLDGPAHIQNRQRPMADGGGSFDRVMATVARLRAREYRFVIRATVTGYSVRHMAEMVEFYVRETGCRELYFEPAFACGRCAVSDDGVPPYDVFAEEYLRAFARARELRAAVRYSATGSPAPKMSFCGLAQDGFSVTPDGLVSSCFEVCDGSHPLAGEFVYGQYDRDAGAFRIDMERLKRLRAMVLTNKPYCDHCFARWQCAGDCPVRVQGTHADFQSPSPRCEMNQHILRGILLQALDCQ